MKSYENCRKNINSIIQKYSNAKNQTFNEANTRFKIIDEILLNLNWSKDDISAEDSYEGKYTDYTLKAFRPIAIVEAKKTANYFELPIGQKRIYQPLKSVYKDNSNLKEAIDQVTDYCQNRSVPIAIICNGWQIIAFIASRIDSIPVLEGKALVIDSLSELENNFKEIWNCLSKVGFESNYLHQKLSGNYEKDLPPKLSSKIYQYPGLKDRNPFQADLQIISDLVLEDVISHKELEKEFLNDCYCKSGALSNYSLVSKQMLSTRYDFLFDENENNPHLESAANKKGVSSNLLGSFSNNISKRPILLIGDVGVGKSTFIDYLRIVEAPHIFNKAISFKIDLGSTAIVSFDIKKAIITEIKNQLLTNNDIDIEDDNFVGNCYHVGLEKFKNSVKVKRLYEVNNALAIEKEIEFLSAKVDNEPEHLRSALDHISKSQKKQIIIFIDNCDQRSDEDQQKAFLIAHEFASKWAMTVFISLRPETYHRTKKESGALSGYHTKAFSISPPRVDEVLVKRLLFALKITNGEINLSSLDSPANFHNLHDLISALIYSLDQNKSLLRFLNNISNENIRKVIELIKIFFGSGHVDMQKILDIYQETEGQYIIPIHELVRAVIYNDNRFYDPINSEIINMFEVRHNVENEHFILPILLSILNDYSSNSRNSGFISIDEIYAYMQGIGYTPIQIDTILNFAYSKKLFEISQKGNSFNKKTKIKLRATQIALYHLKDLLALFSYIDAMIVDTPIFDKDHQDKLKNVSTITDRLQRANDFREYLDIQWKKTNIQTNFFDWMHYSVKLEENIKKISQKIQAKYEKENLPV